MATVAYRMSTTRKINRIFRYKRNEEFASYGIYNPPKLFRLPSDAPPPSVSSDDLGVPFKYELVPILDEHGNPMMDKHGKPLMKKKKIPLTAEEIEAQKGNSEAEKKKKEEEARLKKLEEERQAKLAAMREQNMATFKNVTNGGETANLAQSAEVARKMGFAPSGAELLAIQKKHGDALTYDQVMEAMMNEIAAPEPLDELLSFFKHFDKAGTGYLTKAQIKNLMTAYGEPLTNDEFATLMEICGCATDPVNYVKFVEQLLVAE